MSMGDIDMRYWSNDRLIREVQNLNADVARKDATITGMLGNRARGKRVSVSDKKSRGKLDAKSYEHIWNEAFHTIAQNVISAPITIALALQDGQYSHYFLLNAGLNAVLGPLTMMIQKMKEVH